MKLTKKVLSLNGEIGSSYVEIVADASICVQHIAYGKNIPLVIIDATRFPEITRAIDLHRGFNEGKITSTWGSTLDGEHICLSVKLTEPVETDFIIHFITLKHAILIELIIFSQLLYIQAGKPGDRLKNDLDAPKLLVEVPSSHYADEWSDIFSKVMIRHYKKLKYSKKIAKKLVREQREEHIKIRDFRLKS